MKKKIDLSEIMNNKSAKKNTNKKIKKKEKIEKNKTKIVFSENRNIKTEKEKTIQSASGEIKEKVIPKKAAEAEINKHVELSSILKKDKKEDIVETREFVGFLLGNEEYGIDSDYVRQIIKYKKPLDVGNKSDFIKGILNTKDGVLPVLDIRKRFNMNDDNISDGSIVILDSNNMRIGIFVNYLIGIVRIESDKIGNIPSFLPEHQMQYISSVGLKKDDKIIIILDHNKILSNSDLKEIRALPEDYR